MLTVFRKFAEITVEKVSPTDRESALWLQSIHYSLLPTDNGKKNKKQNQKNHHANTPEKRKKHTKNNTNIQFASMR